MTTQTRKYGGFSFGRVPWYFLFFNCRL